MTGTAYIDKFKKYFKNEPAGFLPRVLFQILCLRL